MRKQFLSFVPISLCLILTSSAQRRPIPPGLHEGEKQINKPLDPPLVGTHSVDPMWLKREADELAQLSCQLPSDLGHLTQGQIPKDLAEKLKRIEKLAKHLRSEISQ